MKMGNVVATIFLATVLAIGVASIVHSVDAQLVPAQSVLEWGHLFSPETGSSFLDRDSPTLTII